MRFVQLAEAKARFSALLAAGEAGEQISITRQHGKVVARIVPEAPRMAAELQVVALDAATSRCYGALRADLERQGVPIGANDYWIAAQALALRAVLVTDNVGEFSRVPGLTVENWLA